MRICLYIAALLLLSGCGGGSSRPVASSEGQPLQYARGFRVERAADYTLVSVRNPWDTLRILRRYVLVPAANELPDNLPEGEVIRTPLRRAVAFSSVHCGVLHHLEQDDVITGICESRYVNIPSLRERIDSGKIAEVGEAAAPNVERILELAPEVLLTTPLEGMSYGRVEKIGIPLIETTDYMENTPLGRAEWIRFYGLFFGCEQRADSLFAVTAESYNALKGLVTDVARPQVISETRHSGSWYVPGGQSFAANLYRDAGADYPWSDNNRAGSVPLSFEQVLERGAEADVWVMKYNAPREKGYADLAADYAGYTRFKAFRERNIYACNTREKPYYEDLPIRPDYILENLIWVFHPDLLPDYEPRYYRKMPE